MSALRPARASAGFTLIELMLALVAGSFVVAGAYYLSDVSARMFNEQIRRTETQMTLRSASEQLRRDIGRAGFMSMRTTNELWDCNSTQGGISVAPRVLQGVQVVSRAGGGQALFLTGNFTTSDQYPVAPGTNFTQLVLSTTRDAFRRSFNNPADGSFIRERFRNAFAPDPTQLLVPQGRMVSIQDLSTGRVFLRDIQAVDDTPGAPTITINPALPDTGGCIPSLTTLVVAPVSTIRYMLEDPNDAAADGELARLAMGNNVLAGGQLFTDNSRRVVLTRREINMVDNQVIPNTARVVLDFVSNRNNFSSFRIEGYFDQAMVVGAAVAQPRLVYALNPENPAQVPNQASLRSLLVELIGESAEAVVAVAAPNERTSRTLAGRRLLRMEVLMPNMAHNPGTL
jgi:prepilin-type N-terminal cleavage/methylation domain-containing protein